MALIRCIASPFWWVDVRAFAFVTLILFAPVAQGQFVQAQTAFEARQEDVESLPEGPGREETFYGCTACHNFSLVSAQGMTRRQWEDTIQLMVERHNMPELAEAEQKVMLDYLKKHYPPRTGRGGWRNPFAQ